jgi:hypothetical protein
MFIEVYCYCWYKHSIIVLNHSIWWFILRLDDLIVLSHHKIDVTDDIERIDHQWHVILFRRIDSLIYKVLIYCQNDDSETIKKKKNTFPET